MPENIRLDPPGHAERIAMYAERAEAGIDIFTGQQPEPAKAPSTFLPRPARERMYKAPRDRWNWRGASVDLERLLKSEPDDTREVRRAKQAAMDAWKRWQASPWRKRAERAEALGEAMERLELVVTGTGVVA